MTYPGTWAGVEGQLLDADLAGHRPEPITDAELVELTAVLDAQWAQLGPEHDPDSPEYWSRLDDVAEALDGFEPAGAAPQGLTEGLTTAARGLGRAALDPGGLTGVTEPDLVDALEAAGRIRSQLDSVTFALASEAAARGLHTEVGLSLPDWLRVRCPWMARSEASHLAQVVAAGQAHWGSSLAEALRAGSTSLHRAALVARTVTRLAVSLDVDQQEAYARIATDAASHPEIGDADLGRVCHTLLVDLLDEAPAGDAVRTAQEQRCLTRRPLGQGMVRYTLDAPLADAALVDGVLAGPLVRPTPEPDGTPDPRSAGQRRYDGLLAVVTRGLGHPGAPPSTARASVVLTLRADPAGGRPTGAATTSQGLVLGAAEAGRYACLGDVTPLVLGERGEPLALGRTQRLASPGQVKALLVRDGSCTYPGCSLPGTWCDAHHLTWWSRGGGTDLDNLALLCSRHHTLVHQRDLTASVDGGTVTWHV